MSARPPRLHASAAAAVCKPGPSAETRRFLLHRGAGRRWTSVNESLAEGCIAARLVQARGGRCLCERCRRCSDQRADGGRGFHRNSFCIVHARWVTLCGGTQRLRRETLVTCKAFLLVVFTCPTYGCGRAGLVWPRVLLADYTTAAQSARGIREPTVTMLIMI